MIEYKVLDYLFLKGFCFLFNFFILLDFLIIIINYFVLFYFDLYFFLLFSCFCVKQWCCRYKLYLSLLVYFYFIWGLVLVNDNDIGDRIDVIMILDEDLLIEGRRRN